MNKIFISTLIIAISIFSNMALAVPIVQPTPKPVPTPAPTPGTGTTPGTTSGALSAVNDYFYVVPGLSPSVTDNVTTNDKGFITAYLQSSPVGTYGLLAFNSTGVFTYTLKQDVNLNGAKSVSDKFVYGIQSGARTATATLTVTIYANQVNGSGVDNVEIEFNDRSVHATPLNSAQRIKGHLTSSSDKDWYSIPSTGDEIIHIGVCEQGSVCYGKKSWVMYVFDGDKLPTITGKSRNSSGAEIDVPAELATTTLNTYRTDGGGVISSQESNAMYLAYASGVFDGALIGIVDPCFDTTNSVDIGVPTLPVNETKRTYYVAISVPLQRDGTGCSDGKIVLERPGLPVTVQDPTAFIQDPTAIIQDPTAFIQDPTAVIPDPTDSTKTILDPTKKILDTSKKILDPTKKILDVFKKIKVTTTEQYLTAFPNSDDEYAITVSNTGKKPLDPNSSSAASASAGNQLTMPSFNDSQHKLNIPKLRIFNDMYTATLSYKGSLIKMSNDPNSQVVIMALKKITGLLEGPSGDPYQATFDPESDQVVLATMRNSQTGDTYSAKLQYHPSLGKKPLYLEVISITKL